MHVHVYKYICYFSLLLRKVHLASTYSFFDDYGFDFAGAYTEKVSLYGDKLDIDLFIISSPAFFNKINETKYYVYNKKSNKLLLNGSLDVLSKGGTNINNKAPELRFTLQNENLQVYKISDIKIEHAVQNLLEVVIEYRTISKSKILYVTGMPGWVTLIPFFFLLIIAMFSSKALIALSSGLLLASTFVNGFNPFYGFIRVLDEYTVSVVSKKDNVKNILFAFYLSAIVAIIQKSGGAKELAHILKSYTKTRSSVQWAVFVLGILLFFDDFTGCLIVGTNMQPVFDMVGLSREKLAYIVHPTSTHPTSMSPISSWIGFELSLIKEEMFKLGANVEPFSIFMKTLPYRFFSILSILFVPINIIFKRDFGPMLKAERRFLKKPQKENQLLQQIDLPINDRIPLRCINAIFPILLVVFATIASMFLTGYYTILNSEEKDQILNASTIIEASSANDSLLYSTMLAFLITCIIYKLQKIMSFSVAINIFVDGVKDVVESVIILVLAWSIGMAFEDLKCAKYIISIASNHLSEPILPTLIFLLSCVISFSTGTSWGTMSVMFPLVMPVIYSISRDEDFMVKSIASIFTGSVFGDQNSPISGSSIITSLACKIPVKNHISTQFPYALFVAFSSVVFGFLPVGFNIYSSYVGLVLATTFLIVTMLFLGAKTEGDSEDRITLSILKVKTLLKSFKIIIKKPICP